MAHRVAPQAEPDLDDIWYYVASESGSVATADRIIDAVISRFLLLSRQPYVGRRRDHDLGSDLRSFPVGEYVIIYLVDGADVFILRVVHGRRDLEEVLG